MSSPRRSNCLLTLCLIALIASPVLARTATRLQPRATTAKAAAVESITTRSVRPQRGDVADVPSKPKPNIRQSKPRGIAPPNDNCANAINIPIASLPFTDTQDTTGASDEQSEPGSTCTAQNNSVWYSFTNTSGNTASVTVSTCNSDFDTALGVWQVNAALPCDFASYIPVACNDDACGDGLQSLTSFIAAPGVTYRFQVGGFDGETGSLETMVSAVFFTCPTTTINGTLGSGDPGFPGTQSSGNQSGRLNRNGVASSCAVPKTCNIFTATGSRAYDAYSIVNQSGSAQCVLTQLTVTGTCNLQHNAYLNSFAPATICTNYLADPGLSSGGAPQTVTNMSFTVPAGQTLVMTVATTNPGETACPYTLTILGNLCAGCTLTCPANVTQSNDANQCGAVVTYPAPTATAGCGTVSCSPASGSFFPVGTTSVTCTATAGPTCQFTVTVNDTQAPAVTCPGNVTRSNDPNQCGAVVTYTATATDNCPGVTLVCTPASGSFFPVGSTPVTCTATDAAGNQAACGFSVIVNDTQPPAITCPANVTATANMMQGTQTGALVSYAAPTASDNCPGLGATACAPASGSFFPTGVTTVTCTVPDAAGNTASCSFTVTVGAGFTNCYVDDATGDTLSIIADPASPLYRLWQYRIALTGQVLQGSAEGLVLVPNRSLTAYDRDSAAVFMELTVSMGSRTATATVTELNGNVRHALRDRNIANDPPCS